ncbi:hypothetical protein LTR86_004226 [Recurvomyces mirabilis]|nr:hypothetical protein LTR86_004226 [Recurvomyces mirabilis]
MGLNIALYLLVTLGVASAHTIMQAVGVNGKASGQGVGIYMPSDDSYQSDVKSDSMACNGSPVTGFTSSSEIISVNAGDTVTGSWLHTLTSTGADSEADNKVIASSHKGPVMAYMKKVADATQNPSAGPGDGWFKISEAGLISSTEWGVDALINAGGVQTVVIPSCIEDGDYLLRFELIALHSASSEGAAQFYMECAQISVSGGSGASTPATYAIPGIYSATDPGIHVNIYNNQGQPYPSSYTIPGPNVFTCGASSASSNATISNTVTVASALVSSANSYSVSDLSTLVASSTSPVTSTSIVPDGTATSTFSGPTIYPVAYNATSSFIPTGSAASQPVASTLMTMRKPHPSYHHDHEHSCS